MISGNIPTAGTEKRKRPPDTNRTIVPFWKRFLAGWYGPSLALILILAACLDFWQLGQHGYSNLYYAAGVRSMLSSWHTFFFVSFDPNGFVSVDKPPVGFWIQVISAKILGFSSFSLLLPQALAGVLSVALLAHLVRRSFGSLAGLLAALALTLTPISVITSRNNDVDTMLVLVTLLATWAMIIATEKGSLRWLFLGLGLVGLGFNIKMTVAYLVVPAFVLLYLLTAPRRWRTRIWQLALAIIVLLAVSLSWPIAVDLTPSTQRPYVGSSGNNSALSLTFGYNGVNRLLGHRPPPTGGEAGYPGPVRLVHVELAGQISWLLPLALIGIIVLLWRKRLLQDKNFRGLVLWGIWFLAAAIFFSFTGSFHVYYMVMFAPAICALTGIGSATLWHEYTNRDIRGWLLPVALLITAAVQWHFLIRYPAWNSWLLPTMPTVVFIVALGLFALRLVRKKSIYLISSGLLTASGLIALLLAPAIWSAAPVVQNRNGAFPVAGPYGSTTPPPVNTQSTAGGNTQTQKSTSITVSITDSRLLQFLEVHQRTASYLFATTGSLYAAPVIVETGKAVMTMGGYSGGDRILTRNKLIGLVQKGVVRYFLLPESASHSSGSITGWIQSACTPVPSSAWYPERPATNKPVHIETLILYDCMGD